MFALPLHIAYPIVWVCAYMEVELDAFEYTDTQLVNVHFHQSVTHALHHVRDVRNPTTHNHLFSTLISQYSFVVYVLPFTLPLT
jgi:hypothetical protein